MFEPIESFYERVNRGVWPSEEYREKLAELSAWEPTDETLKAARDISIDKVKRILSRIDR